MDDKNLKNNENITMPLLDGAPSWSVLIEFTEDILDFFVKGIPKYENVKGVLETAEEAAKKFGVIPTKAIEKIHAQEALAY